MKERGMCALCQSIIYEGDSGAVLVKGALFCSDSCAIEAGAGNVYEVVIEYTDESDEKQYDIQTMEALTTEEAGKAGLENHRESFLSDSYDSEVIEVNQLSTAGQDEAGFICPYCKGHNDINEGSSEVLESGLCLITCAFCGLTSVGDKVL